MGRAAFPILCGVGIVIFIRELRESHSQDVRVDSYAVEYSLEDLPSDTVEL